MGLHSCKIMNCTIKNMTIPSQTRYLAYLTKILQNKQIPKSNPLMIQRVIVHKIPIFEINQETHYITKQKTESINAQQIKLSDANNERSPSILDPPPKHFMIGDDDDENEDDEELGSNVIDQQQQNNEEQAD